MAVNHGHTLPRHQQKPATTTINGGLALEAHARGCFDDSLKIPVAAAADRLPRRWESGNLIYFLADSAAIELGTTRAWE